VPRGIIDEDDV